MRAQRGIGDGHNIIGEAEGDKLVLREEGMDFDLIHGGLYIRVAEEGRYALFGEVGEADGFCETAGVDRFHCAPSGLRVGGQGMIDDVLYICKHV